MKLREIETQLERKTVRTYNAGQVDTFHFLATSFMLTSFWYVVTSKLKVLAKEDRLEGWAES